MESKWLTGTIGGQSQFWIMEEMPWIKMHDGNDFNNII